MSNIIIIYSTTDGHTREICSYLEQVVEALGHQVTLVDIDDADEADLKPFDKIVIGASIRYGKHDKKIYEFIETEPVGFRKQTECIFLCKCCRA